MQPQHRLADNLNCLSAFKEYLNAFNGTKYPTYLLDERYWGCISPLGVPYEDYKLPSANFTGYVPFAFNRQKIGNIRNIGNIGKNGNNENNGDNGNNGNNENNENNEKKEKNDDFRTFVTNVEKIDQAINSHKYHASVLFWTHWICSIILSIGMGSFVGKSLRLFYFGAKKWIRKNFEIFVENKKVFVPKNNQTVTKKCKNSKNQESIV